MMPLSLHKQVPCKVTAYVDEGIKELVELLNQIDGVSTFESCQGKPGKRLAFVYMAYGDNNSEGLIRFASELSKAFARYTKDSIDTGGYLSNISVEWQGDKKFPFLSIEMPIHCIPEVTRLLSLFHSEYKNNKLGK